MMPSPSLLTAQRAAGQLGERGSLWGRFAIEAGRGFLRNIRPALLRPAVTPPDERRPVLPQLGAETCSCPSGTSRRFGASLMLVDGSTPIESIDGRRGLQMPTLEKCLHVERAF
jgi:hypothetical protein